MELGFGLELQRARCPPAAEQPRSRPVPHAQRHGLGFPQPAPAGGLACPQRFPVGARLPSSLRNPGVSVVYLLSSKQGSCAECPSKDGRAWQLQGGWWPCPYSLGGTERNLFMPQASG